MLLMLAKPSVVPMLCALHYKYDCCLSVLSADVSQTGRKVSKQKSLMYSNHEQMLGESSRQRETAKSSD